MADKVFVRAKLGQPFEIREPSNPSTGYKWSPMFNEGAVRFESEQFEKSSTMLGGGGQQKFVFLPTKRGSATIRLIYKRPWESVALKESCYEVVVE